MAQISVIVPVYKVEPYLHRCVDSILGQTFSDFDLILVDDGSQDRCPQICDEYAQRDNRVHVIHQENGGLSAARNAGIDWAFENSDSQWMMFVDSDDWIHKQMLYVLLNANLSNQTMISMSYLERTSGEETIPQSIPVPIVSDPEQIWCNEPLPMVAWGKLYSKTCFQNIRYPVGKLHEDEYVTYRLLFAEPLISVVRCSFYYYFRNPEGITRVAWTPRRLDRIEAIKEQILFFNEFGYRNAYNSACIYYMEILVNDYHLSKKQSNRDYRAIQKDLIKQLRKAIHRYKSTLELTPQKQPHYFETAYYHEMQVYWLYQVVKTKLKNILR